jgi:alkylation response protein AidB-like acyl-CoA dehydrogenase
MVETSEQRLPLSLLREEEKLFQASVRRFAKERLAPHVRSMDDAGKFRPELLDEMFELGLMGIDVSDQYGGQDGTFFQSILAIEELAKVDPSASVIVDVQNTLVNNAIARWGTEGQKKTYLSDLASRAVGSYALSEAGSGSDAFALRTKAQPDGDGFLLSGRKLWITNAAEATIFLVFATVDESAGYK